MKLLICIAGFAAIAVSDLPGLIKEKQRREIIIYAVIFILVLAFAAFTLLNAEMPSVIRMIQSFYRDVLHLSFKTPG